MRNDSLKQYLQLQESLRHERTTLQARLARINEALAGTATPDVAPSAPPVPKARKPGKSKHARNQLSLRDAMRRVAQGRPMTKPEIQAAVENLGYRFATRQPIGSINSILYGTPKWTNESGKFSPPK